jgi:PAS domain S-box-containing protein
MFVRGATKLKGRANYGLACLPTPVLLFGMIALWVADVRTVWPLPPLNWLIHYGAGLMAAVLIVIPAGRSFLAGGPATVLVMGAGALIMELGILFMPIAYGRSENTAFTIYNTSALLSAICNLVGVGLTSLRLFHVKRSAAWLPAVYAGAAGAMGIVFWASLTGRMPVFFMNGQGGTIVRTAVVGTAAALFILTAWLLWQMHCRTPSPFHYWYALGLMLLATGLSGSLLLSIKDSPLHWVVRFTQLWGACYLCVAAWSAARASGAGANPLWVVEEAWHKAQSMASTDYTPDRLVLRYGLAVPTVAVALAGHLMVDHWFGPGFPWLITFFPAVMLVALYAGFGPGMLATLLTDITAFCWFMPAGGWFNIISPVNRLSLVLFAVVGVATSSVAELYRRGRSKAAAYDRQEALREMLREKEFLANLLQRASQPFAIWYPDGRHGLCNLAYEQLTGYAAAELPTLNWSTTLTPLEWRDCEKEELEKLHRSGQPVRYEKEYVRKDSTRVPIELLVHLARDPQGNPAYYYAFIVDITERKQANEALQRVMEDLKRSNSDLEQFAYVASHDLQEPLRAVCGYVELLKQRFPEKLDAKAVEYVNGASDGAVRMARLISDLLTFARVQTHRGNFKITSLDAVLNAALQNLKYSIQSTHAQITNDPLPTLAVDAAQIQQIFQNLVGNAIKFCEAGPPVIHVGAEVQNGDWVFSVRDNGIGIDPQFFGRIFQIFQRLHTRTEYTGTGIGLAICKKIVERHGGRIWVDSKPGAGSVFYFAIPAQAG